MVCFALMVASIQGGRGPCCVAPLGHWLCCSRYSKGVEETGRCGDLKWHFMGINFGGI